MDYSELTAAKSTDGSIKNWFSNDTLPSTTILTEAQEWIYRRLRVRQMLALATGTLTIGNDYLDLPTRFLASRSFWFSGTDRAELQHVTLNDVESARIYDGAGSLSTGKPNQFYVDETRAYFSVAANQAYPYRWRFYQQPAALATGNLTNFLTDRHPRLLRCACMAFANEFMKRSDDRLYWLRLAEGEVEAIHREDDEVRWDLDVSVVVT